MFDPIVVGIFTAKEKPYMKDFAKYYRFSTSADAFEQLDRVTTHLGAGNDIEQTLLDYGCELAPGNGTKIIKRVVKLEDQFPNNDTVKIFKWAHIISWYFFLLCYQ